MFTVSCTCELLRLLSHQGPHGSIEKFLLIFRSNLLYCFAPFTRYIDILVDNRDFFCTASVFIGAQKWNYLCRTQLYSENFDSMETLNMQSLLQVSVQ